ncbi:MAG: ABC transporter permease [Lachnospiraceae bacterium]
MFNLLRMDLYRVKRSKSLYICFLLLMLATVLVYGMMWMLETPKGQEISLRIGMITPQEAAEAGSILDGIDSLGFFRQISLDGGMYNLIFGIWVMLFVCADFQSGFIKNIMAMHQNRWNYIGSKVMTAWIVDGCYLGLHFLFALLMNRLFGNLVPYAGWGDAAFYLSWVWFVTAAFASLIIFICVLTRSVAAGSLAAVLLGGGPVVMTLYKIMDMFHMGDWLEYSIYLTCAMGPQKYVSVKDLYVYAVGFGFLILYSMLAGIVLKKEDI